MVNLIKLTILSQDDWNGKPVYLRPENVHKAIDFEVSDSEVHIIGKTKKIKGTLLWLTPNGSATQKVQESPEEVYRAVELGSLDTSSGKFTVPKFNK